jgi:small conductance mechanosensitive channel
MNQAKVELGALWGALLDKLEHWALSAVRLLPNLLIALLVLAGAVVLSRGLYRLARTTLDRASPNPQLNHLGASLARLLILGGGLSVALSVLGLDKAVTSLLAGVGVLGIVIGFALQETGANFVAGILMAVRQPFRLGEIVQTKDYLGVVEDIDLRATTLRQFSGEIVQVPNKDVFSNPIENLSALGRRRIDVPVGVAYGSDLRQVREVTLAAAARVEGRLPEHPPEVLFTGFGESSVDLVVRVWAPYQSNAEWLGVKSDLIVAVYEAYAEAGISIPFPIRTLDLGRVSERLERLLASAPDG